MINIKLVQGFTLVEMIIVLVISVLGFAVLGGNISSGNQTTKIQTVANDIASALHYAQGEALLTHIPVSVAINLDENTYRISNVQKVYKINPEIEVSLVVASDEVVGGEGQIRFFEDGSSTGGRITLEWGNQLRRLDVNWITGEVTIKDVAA
jgi:general secretion pathway protein H